MLWSLEQEVTLAGTIHALDEWLRPRVVNHHNYNFHHHHHHHHQ